MIAPDNVTCVKEVKDVEMFSVTQSPMHTWGYFFCCSAAQDSFAISDLREL